MTFCIFFACSTGMWRTNVQIVHYLGEDSHSHRTTGWWFRPTCICDRRSPFHCWSPSLLFRFVGLAVRTIRNLIRTWCACFFRAPSLFRAFTDNWRTRKRRAGQKLTGRLASVAWNAVDQFEDKRRSRWKCTVADSCAPSPEKMVFFSFKVVHFDEFWTLEHILHQL